MVTKKISSVIGTREKKMWVLIVKLGSEIRDQKL